MIVRSRLTTSWTSPAARSRTSASATNWCRPRSGRCWRTPSTATTPPCSPAVTSISRRSSRPLKSCRISKCNQINPIQNTILILLKIYIFLYFVKNIIFNETNTIYQFLTKQIPLIVTTCKQPIFISSSRIPLFWNNN